MDNTSKLDFLFQDKNDLVKTSDYVLIQAGKGRRDNSSIHIKAVEFSYVEGLIWDKYREYGIKKKIKITSSDWERILTGFEESLEPLEVYKSGDDLEDILKFELFRAQNPINNVVEYTKEIKHLLTELTSWILSHVENEKHITIIKQHI
ncbi:hypothetical protein KQ51_01609 [Candidatus Izimaplasma bacterium HR1]|jgi:hypothetical protein|uniref:hypothetical protein n=1 Tax=Candidatus Izimoplasma sp. HR1 TaxID=1541959 RepID=UPI0004F6A003|nr:hypothetical protein KQ51_01609 [Candidatus Izimaplasma bacterium HR1]